MISSFKPELVTQNTYESLKYSGFSFIEFHIRCCKSYKLSSDLVSNLLNNQYKSVRRRDINYSYVVQILLSVFSKLLCKESKQITYPVALVRISKKYTAIDTGDLSWRRTCLEEK